MSDWPILTLLVFFPVAACLVLPFIRGTVWYECSRWWWGLVELLLALPLLRFDLSVSGYQFQEKAAWVPQWGLHYHLGMDGISLLMVLLTVLLLPLCVLCSWTYIGRRVKEFHFSLMLMTSPAWASSSPWTSFYFTSSGKPCWSPCSCSLRSGADLNADMPSLKFFLYTLAGSTLLLVAMVRFTSPAGPSPSLSLSAKSYPFSFQCWIFLAMAFAFCHQGAHVPVPYLAAGRACGSPHGRKRPAGLGSAQNGGLRVHCVSACP